MKKFSVGFLTAALLAVCGCDDSNNSAMQCSTDCGHGTCFMNGTVERCQCEEGYSTDAEGICSVAEAPTIAVSDAAVKDGQISFRLTFKANAEFDDQNVVFSVRRYTGDTPEVLIATGPSTVISDQFKSNRKISYAIEARSGDIKAKSTYLSFWNEDTAWDWRKAVMYFAFIDRFYNGRTSNDNPLNIASQLTSWQGGKDGPLVTVNLTDWMGGDFSGLLQVVKSGYFDRIGVNTLWISSVMMNTQKAAGASAYHSYWPFAAGYSDITAPMFSGSSSNGVGFTPIEPHFGSLTDLRALVSACHDRGMRVVVDFAVNHAADDSPIYKQKPEWFNYSNAADIGPYLCEGPRQADGSMPQENWNKIPETCWFSENLPDFDYTKPEVREMIVEHAKWVIRETGIDGFRLDAVKHMPTELIEELRSGIDDMMSQSAQTFYIVGETFDGMDKIKQYIGDKRLHGQFDFPLYNVIRSTLMRAADNPESEYWRLKDFVKYNDTAYDGMSQILPENRAIMSTFIGNHDVARAISHIHFDPEDKSHSNPAVTENWAYHRLRVSLAFIMTSPMVPMIYYGDEFGLEGANDPDNRRMMKFDEDLNSEQKSTLALMEKLGQIRRDHPALSIGKRKTINAKARSYMYLMQDETETILIGLSDLGEGQCEDDGEPYIVDEGANGWTDLLNPGTAVSQTNSITFCGNQIYIWKANK